MERMFRKFARVTKYCKVGWAMPTKIKLKQFLMLEKQAENKKLTSTETNRKFFTQKTKIK